MRGFIQFIQVSRGRNTGDGISLAIIGSEPNVARLTGESG